MKLISQSLAMHSLDELARCKRHSILISGPPGCGKTYLARHFANLLGVADFQLIDPKVDSIRDAASSCYGIDSDTVLCIENLDTGVLAASYSLLKFLEEPYPNTYIVVTVRNISKVPDTILSRAACIATSPPSDADMARYAMSSNPSKFEYIKDSRLWKCARTFNDAESILNMSDVHVKYFEELERSLDFSDSVSSLIWKLQKFPDGSSTPVEIVIQYIMGCYSSYKTVQVAGLNCLKDIGQGRIAAHAAIAKFVFDLKYSN